MLILTRRTGETLHIGDDVTVTVLEVKGRQVRIGIDAPKTIAVHRAEIYKRIKKEEKEREQTIMDTVIDVFNTGSKKGADNG